MKKILPRLISILLIPVLCFFALPVEAYAWGKMTHVYTANLISEDAEDNYAVINYPYDNKDSAKSFHFPIPEEFLQAINTYPDAFRAGALGPDVYPDIITGQMYIHPETETIDSGEWVTLLCDAVNKMGKDTEGRKIALSFTLGCILHYCGDLFGHDFVNTFSGGSFPSLLSPDILDLQGEKLNNVLSHLSVEKYMDELLYPYYLDDDGDINAPDRFISDAMIFDGTPAAGLASLYEKYPAFDLGLEDIDSDLLKDILDEFFDENNNNVPPHYSAMLALREYVTSTADEYRENMDPVSAIITRYCDEWAADIDRGIYEFTATCDSIARRMTAGGKNPKIEEAKEWEDWKNTFNPNSLYDEVLEDLDEKGFLSKDNANGFEDSTLGIVKEEMDFWLDKYGIYMIGIPDILIDGISIDNIDDMDARKALQTIVDFATLSPLFDSIKQGIKKLIARFIGSEIIEIAKQNVNLSGDQIAALVRKMNDRLEDPSLQLEHPDNPYQPSADNFAELMEYLDSLPEEKQNSNSESDFEALYNTIAMFKLVLMGPENYATLLEGYGGVKQTAYQMNTAHPEASSLQLEIKTSELYLSGTNDNIYVLLYKLEENGTRTQLTSELLDISGTDDFEAGDTRTYTVELPMSVKLTELEIGLRKTPAFDFLPSLTDDWHCENIRVTPMYAGYKISDPIDLGGIQLRGICDSVGMDFQSALKAGRDPKNQAAQNVTNLKVRVKVKDELYAGSDSDIYLVAYNGEKRQAKICLDIAMYNDLERGDDDTYLLPVTSVGWKINSIPLNKLRIAFEHDGSDEANWQEVIVTPCYGSLELTDPISLGGKKFSDTTWKPDFQKSLKKVTFLQYDPIATEYKTVLDDGLLSYMDSLDGGEEWVDADNELWANTKLRRKVFFEIFKGFEPEINYTGEPTALQNDPVDLALDFTGVWNGVSNDRRSKVKDFQYVSPVKGSVDIVLVNEKNEVVYSASKVDVTNNFASHSIRAGKLAPGTYDLKISYVPDDADPMYADTSVTIENALRVLDAGEAIPDLAITTQPENVTADIGQKATFTIAVTGGKAPYAYKWQISENGSWRNADSSWGSGFDSASFSFTVEEDKLRTGQEYRCVVTDASGQTVTSKTVSVSQKTGSPEIITHPKDVTAEEGQIVTFTVEVSGGSTPYSYYWQIPSGGSWSILQNSSIYSGQGTNTLSYTVTANGPAKVRCVVIDSAGKDVTSNAANITAVAPLVITGQPQNASCYAGQTVTFTVRASGGIAPYRYYWQIPSGASWSNLQNSSLYSGQGTNTLTFKTTANGPDKVRCVIIDSTEKDVTSNVANITVTVPDPLVVTKQPTDKTEKKGVVIPLEVQVQGGLAPLSYQWQGSNDGRTWSDLKNGNGLEGVSTPKLSIQTEKTDFYPYARCVISDSLGSSVTSNTASITIIYPLAVSINNGQPSITLDQPSEEEKTLTADVTGGVGQYTYKWLLKRFISNQWEEMATTPSYTVDSFYPHVNARIKVEVTDSTGKTVTSNEVLVNVTGVIN